MSKIQRHKIQSAAICFNPRRRTGCEMQPKRILQSTYSGGESSHSDTGIASSTERGGAPDGTGQVWVGHRNVADVTVNVSYHSREDNSLGYYCCDMDCTYLANTNYSCFVYIIFSLLFVKANGRIN